MEPQNHWVVEENRLPPVNSQVSRSDVRPRTIFTRLANMEQGQLEEKVDEARKKQGRFLRLPSEDRTSWMNHPPKAGDVEPSRQEVGCE